MKICRYLRSLQQWEPPMRISFTGNCQMTRKNCCHFSMKSYVMSVKKNYNSIERVFIICKWNILWVSLYMQKRGKEGQSCTLQAELGGRHMKRIPSSYRLLVAVPIINASFAACIKMSVSGCRLWKNLRKI